MTQTAYRRVPGLGPLRGFRDYEAFVVHNLWGDSEAAAKRMIEETVEKYPHARGLLNAISSYHAAGTSAAPANNSAYADIWCPTRPIEITHLEIWNTTTTVLAQTNLVRVTARGTQSTTVTPTAAANANNSGYMLAPTFVIDTSWSVQPTFAAVPMVLADMAGTIGTSTFWDWGDQDPLQVVNGNGIAFENTSGGATGVTRVGIRCRE